MMRYFIFCATFVFFLTGIISQDNTTATHYVTDKFDGIHVNNTYCFRFTWLGPEYDNTSKVNGSCNDLAKKYNMKDTPCKQPLVITDNAEPPNMTELKQRYQDYVLCRSTKGQVCIKYSYRFNGKLDNITYMCGKVITEGEGAETSGCFIQYVSGYEKEVCMCKPHPMTSLDQMPCNSASAHEIPALVLFTALLVFTLIYRW